MTLLSLDPGFGFTVYVLAVLNDHNRPPINIQNRRNKQTFDTYAFTFDIVPLVLEGIYFAGHTFEYKWKTKQKAQSKKRKVEMCEENKWKHPPTHQSWAEHHRGRALGPATSPPGKGRVQASQPGCGRTLGAPVPQAAWPGPSFLQRLHDGMHRRFTAVS